MTKPIFEHHHQEDTSSPEILKGRGAIEQEVGEQATKAAVYTDDDWFKTMNFTDVEVAEPLIEMREQLQAQYDEILSDTAMLDRGNPQPEAIASILRKISGIVKVLEDNYPILANDGPIGFDEETGEEIYANEMPAGDLIKDGQWIVEMHRNLEKLQERLFRGELQSPYFSRGIAAEDARDRSNYIASA